MVSSCWVRQFKCPPGLSLWLDLENRRELGTCRAQRRGVPRTSAFTSAAGKRSCVSGSTGSCPQASMAAQPSPSTFGSIAWYSAGADRRSRGPARPAGRSCLGRSRRLAASCRAALARPAAGRGRRRPANPPSPLAASASSTIQPDADRPSSSSLFEETAAALSNHRLARSVC